MRANSAGERTHAVIPFICQAVLRRKFRIITVLLLWGIFLGIRLAGQDWAYRSTAVLHIITPGNYVFPASGLFGSPGSGVYDNCDFMDEVEIIGNRTLAEAVVREIGAEKIAGERKPGSPFVAGVESLLRRCSPKRENVSDRIENFRRRVTGKTESHSDLSDFERALGKLLSGTKISADPHDHTIRVTVILDQPFLARPVLTLLIQKYREMHRIPDISNDSYGFLARKADSLAAEQAELARIITRLNTAKQISGVRNGFPDLEGSINDLHHDLVVNELAIATLMARIGSLERLLGQRGSKAPEKDGNSSPISFFGAKGSPVTERGADPQIERELKGELSEAYSARSRLREDSENLRRRVEKLERKLEMTVLLEDSMKFCLEKRTELEMQRARYTGKFAEARLQHLFHPGRYPLVEVYRPASYSEPVPFSRFRGAVSGMVIGILCIGGYALAAEYLHCRGRGKRLSPGRFVTLEESFRLPDTPRRLAR